jgi:hypothetical protein
VWCVSANAIVHAASTMPPRIFRIIFPLPDR